MKGKDINKGWVMRAVQLNMTPRVARAFRLFLVHNGFSYAERNYVLNQLLARALGVIK